MLVVVVDKFPKRQRNERVAEKEQVTYLLYKKRITICQSETSDFLIIVLYQQLRYTCVYIVQMAETEGNAVLS